jgi:hypothetical protein
MIEGSKEEVEEGIILVNHKGKIIIKAGTIEKLVERLHTVTEGTSGEYSI